MPGRKRSYAEDVASDGGLAGRAIRARREHLGMFTTTLAARVGVSQGYLANVELGRSTPRIDKLRKFADVLAMSLSELAGEPASAEFERGRRAGLYEAVLMLRRELDL